MRFYIFSSDDLTPRDYRFISEMLDSLTDDDLAPQPMPRPTQRIDKLYSDDVLKLARELNLSVESTLEVMSYKKRPT